MTQNDCRRVLCRLGIACEYLPPRPGPSLPELYVWRPWEFLSAPRWLWASSVGPASLRTTRSSQGRSSLTKNVLFPSSRAFMMWMAILESASSHGNWTWELSVRASEPIAITISFSSPKSCSATWVARKSNSSFLFSSTWRKSFHFLGIFTLGSTLNRNPDPLFLSHWFFQAVIQVLPGA